MLRQAQHERKYINDFSTPPFALSCVEGEQGFSAELEKEARVWLHCIKAGSPLRYSHGPSSEVSVARSFR